MCQLLASQSPEYNQQASLLVAPSLAFALEVALLRALRVTVQRVLLGLFESDAHCCSWTGSAVRSAGLACNLRLAVVLVLSLSDLGFFGRERETEAMVA